MRKKIFISLGIVVVLLAVAFFYFSNRNRTLSPPGSAEITAGDLSVSVSYSRPSVRNRVIFGSVEEGALQPYGKYWRLGANEPTLITFSKDVLFNNEPVKAGTYWIYAVPGPSEFEVSLNSESAMWGAAEPDYSLDVLKTNVPVEKQSTTTEQHTISLEKAGSGINVVVSFEKVKFSIPVQAQ